MADHTEKDLLLIEHALHAAAKPRLYEAVPDLPVVLQELDGWLADEHQWRSGRPQNWATLLSDLNSAWKKMGPKLHSRLSAVANPSYEETQLVRRALKQGNLPPDESMRRRLQRSASAIRSELLQDASLLAAWTDLLESTGPSAAASSARLLLRLGELHGHAADSLIRRLRSILSDEYFAVTLARGETPSRAEVPNSADASVTERIQLATGILTELPRRADVVVWLLYALAPKLWPPILEIGERVTLYDVEWLHAASESPNPAYPVPGELTENGFGISAITGDRGKSSDDPNAVPYVAARISLGKVRVSEAEAIARRSAEALIALASLHGGHVCPWIVEDSFAMFIDGGSGPSTFAAPAVFEPSSAQRSAMSEDWTAEVIGKNADRWGRHFPIQDHRMQEAAHLLVWLRKARETWGPARLVLCDRVIERVAGWAGLSSPRRLITDHLKIQWAITAMRSECANVAWGAMNANDIFSAIGDRQRIEALQRAREEIRQDPDLEFNLGERSWSVNPRGVLKKLDWLSARVPNGGPIAERISKLKDRTRTGSAGAAWADDLMVEFSTLEARARRVRNVLIHGGPVSDLAADEILPFVESLAESALFASVEGRLDEVALVDFFLDRRTANMEVLDALRNRIHPIDALWQNADDPQRADQP